MCDHPDFYDEKFVTARKPHKCCETGRMIQPGEHYWRIVGKWDGDLSTFAQSEAAYHFARFLNGVREGGGFGNYDGESCIGFGMIGGEVPPDMLDEWEAVKRGIITRWTLSGAKPDHVSRQFSPYLNQQAITA